MSDILPVIRVKPWGKDQGEFVEINADDFDPAKHEPHDALDHDGEGHKGGSLPGDASTARKGAAKRRKGS